MFRVYNTQNGCKVNNIFRNSKEKQTQNRKRRQISENCKLRIANYPFSLFSGFFQHHKNSTLPPKHLHRFSIEMIDHLWRKKLPPYGGGRGERPLFILFFLFSLPQIILPFSLNDLKFDKNVHNKRFFFFFLSGID